MAAINSGKVQTLQLHQAGDISGPVAIHVPATTVALPDPNAGFIQVNIPTPFAVGATGPSAYDADKIADGRQEYRNVVYKIPLYV